MSECKHVVCVVRGAHEVCKQSRETTRRVELCDRPVVAISGPISVVFPFIRSTEFTINVPHVCDNNTNECEYSMKQVIVTWASILIS